MFSRHLQHQSTLESDSSDSEGSSTDGESRRSAGSFRKKQKSIKKMERNPIRRNIGFGDLCRYFYRSLREDNEDDYAHEVCCKLKGTIIANLFKDFGKDDRVLEKEWLFLW